MVGVNDEVCKYISVKVIGFETEVEFKVGMSERKPCFTSQDRAAVRNTQTYTFPVLSL